MTIYSDTLRFIRDILRQFKARPGLQYLLIIAIMVRLCYLMMMLGQAGSDPLLSLAPDTTRYVNIGQSLAGYGPADEGAVMIFGPGYGAFLGLIFSVFGVRPIVILLIQVILSSFACLMLYRLGHELTGIKSVGYLAGYSSALSFTSISLANFILSDTLFYFLFLWGCLAFILGLKNYKRSYFIFAGLCLGAAILVRSIGQFWPIVTLFIILIWPRPKSAFPFALSRLRFMGRASIAVLVAIIIMALWAGRNYVVHGLPMIAFTGAGGPANVAKLTLNRIESRDPAEIVAQWQNEYREENGVAELSMADTYRMYSAAASRVFTSYPGESIDTYRALVWENLHAVNELYRFQLPQFMPRILDMMWWMKNRSLNYLSFWLSLAGLGLLLIFRRWQAGVFLGLLYLYFVSMIGFTQWQGSRLFYPGQMASSIMIAFLIAAAGKSIWWVGQRLRK